jgi:hypothetical protein
VSISAPHSSCNFQLIPSDAKLDLVNETGAAVAAMKIKLQLVSEPEQDFMKSVAADMACLNGSSVLATAYDHAEAAISMASTGRRAAQTLGVPVGKALQLIVKFMDGIADVRTKTHSKPDYSDCGEQIHPIVKVSWTVLSSVYKVRYSPRIETWLYISLH